MVKVDDKDLYQLFIAEFRYAAQRDNHLAPSGCVQHIRDYLPEMSKSWRAHTAYQLTDEIIQERLWQYGAGNTFEQDAEWEKLLAFLTNYIEEAPPVVEKYMRHLKGPAVTIDYNSAEIRNKIAENKLKD